jgi:putative methyltransferase (TIGR04325 family)
MSNPLQSFSGLLKMLGEISVALARRIDGGGVTRAPTFANFEDALLFCGTDGYKQTEIVDVVVAKTVIVKSKMEADSVLNLDSLRTVIGLAASQPSKGLTVIDFGGAAGAHYTTARTILGKSFPLRWHVVETEEMAEAARAVLADDSLRFFSTLDSAAVGLGSVDLILASGSLQYTPDPMSFLKRILSLKAKHIFITRTVLTDTDRAFTMIQVSRLAAHGQGPLTEGFKDREILTPVTVVEREQFEQELKETYDIRFRVLEDKKAHRHNGETFDMFGYFLDLKK